ncbi:MAG TPA: BON domain-containing protein [Ferrovibrio sp.]|uniref:BON domain-containing protein n=1 Tax=Ferrovibrio sp. TaxID=1917215 RepID=UPI002ED3A024
MRILLRSLAVILILGSAVAGCTATSTRESAGEYLDSAAITAKVKAAILEDKQLKVMQISVETFRGVVQLSGFVDSAADKARAEQVVRGVEGVRGVRNDLVIKPR